MVLRLLPFLIFSIASLYAGGATDTRFWLELGSVKSINKCIDFEFDWGERWKGNCKHPHYTYADIAFYFKAGDSWELQPSYRHVYRLSNGEWEEDHNPRFSVIKHWDFCRIRFSDRNRIDYRDLSNIFYYRNRFKAVFPHRFLPFDLAPFVATEVYLKKGTTLSQARFETGVLREVRDNYRRRNVKLSYMHRLRDDSGTWHGYHTILFTLLVAM